MNEFIEVRFEKNGKRLRVNRQLPGGIEFDEPDPLERTVGLQFSARSEATRVRMDSIRRIQGWEPGQFKLSMSVEDGSILLRGMNQHALPEGSYRIPWPSLLRDGPKTVLELIWHVAASLPKPDAAAGEAWTRARVQAEIRRIVGEQVGAYDYSPRFLTLRKLPS